MSALAARRYNPLTDRKRTQDMTHDVVAAPAAQAALAAMRTSAQRSLPQGLRS
jgi:hypothetical protein